MSSRLPPQARVAVIGAGVSGLVATKRLAEEGLIVTLYERRRTLGGLWNFSKQPENAGNSEGRFASAVYGDLHTNFPRQLMEFQDHPQKDQPIFMSHRQVLKYLKDYAKNTSGDDLRLRTDKEVIDLYFEKSGPETGVWHLTTKDVSTGSKLTKQFEAVVVAVGMFDKPYFPEIHGLNDWKTQWPDHISHAKSFRNSRAFQNKKVLIVGYQASGFDLARQIAPTAAKVWISSTRDISDQVPEDVGTMPEISRLEPKDRQVVFEDGRKLWRVDHVIFCTGYKFSQPFIKAGKRSKMPMFPDGPNIDHLYEHVVYKENPSLAFIGMIQGGAPTFLVVQAQAAFVSRLWAGRLSMNKLLTVTDREPDDDNPRHLIPYPQFMDYLLRLQKLCQTAHQRMKEGKAEGNLPFKWTLELDWIRQNRREIREAFMARPKNERKTITALDQLGFSVKLSPSSPNIEMVIPFLILHAAHFPGEHSDLIDAYFPRQLTRGAAFRGTELFEQIRMIFKWTQQQLQPRSRALFREGTERLLKFGLERVEEANTDIEDPGEEASSYKATGRSRVQTGALKDVQVSETESLSLKQHQKRMEDIYAGIFGSTYLLI